MATKLPPAVDLQTASSRQLESLPNIGPKSAQEIIQVDFSDSEEEGAVRYPEKEVPGTEYAQLSLMFQQMMATNLAQFKQISSTVEKMAASQEETRQEMLRLGD